MAEKAGEDPKKTHVIEAKSGEHFKKKGVNKTTCKESPEKNIYSMT